jgi:hypothetical protein
MNDSALLLVVRFIIFIKCTTSSDAFHYFYISDVFASPSHLRRIWTKHVTGSGTFRPHHWQWRTIIRIFKILRFLLLFLIILI